MSNPKTRIANCITTDTSLKLDSDNSIDLRECDIVSKNDNVILINSFQSKSIELLLEEADYLKSSLNSLIINDACIVCFSVNELVTANAFISSLDKKRLYSLPISVIVFDSNYSIKVLKPFSFSQPQTVQRSSNEWKSYWCWWRDSSQYEVAILLKLSMNYDNESGDIYTSFVYPKFFNMMIDGKTQKWDGTPRKKKYSVSSFKAEKQNYKIPLVQLGLWEPESGRITPKGKSLLFVISKYGVDSKEYFDALAKLILLDGKHVFLIKDLYNFQITNKQLIPETSSEFFLLFEKYMSTLDLIGTRKPTAVTTGAKKTYIRDEPKLWNKLGLIKTDNNRYYKPFIGIDFNWERINQILLSETIGEYYE